MTADKTDKTDTMTGNTAPTMAGSLQPQEGIEVRGQRGVNTALIVIGLIVGIVALIMGVATLLIQFLQPIASFEKQLELAGRLDILETQAKTSSSKELSHSAKITALQSDLLSLRQTVTENIIASAQIQAASDALNMISVEDSSLSPRLTGLEQSFALLSQETTATTSAIEKTNRRVDQLRETYSTLALRTDAFTDNWDDLSKQLSQQSLVKVETLNTQLANTNAAVVELKDQLSSLQKANETLAAMVDAQSAKSTAHTAKLLVIGRLRDALEVGQNVQAEIQAVRRVVADRPSVVQILTPLQEVSSVFVPTLPTLTETFIRLWEKVRLDAKLEANTDNQLGRMWVRIKNLVGVQRIDGEAEIMAISGIEGHLARAHFYMSQNRLDEAIASLKQIEPPFDQTLQEFLRALTNRHIYNRAIVDLDRWLLETMSLAAERQ